jgi:formylglycine-generating enzyme required for sulfatase activity
MTKFIVGLLTLIFVATFGAASGADASAAPELVLIPDAGNVGRKLPFKDLRDTYPRGAVAYPYRLGKTEVTNAEYAEFLNHCARADDARNLYDERMAIARSGAAGEWTYAPRADAGNRGVNFVSRVSAARYCNFLTTGDPEVGAYQIADCVRENGKTFPAIVGYRDLTFPDAARIFYLPDMHEFYKAGWFDPASGWQEYDQDSRAAPSPYGIVDHAGGVREWMDNKYYAGGTFAFGGDDAATLADDLNAVTVFQVAEYEGNARTGFRVAATAPLQIGDRLNRRRNFFFDDNDAPATLRVRYDGAEKAIQLALELRDFANQKIWETAAAPVVAAGVTEIPVPLPDRDGYYELFVTPRGDSAETQSFSGQTVIIPLAIMREKMPALGAEGNFGLTCHLTRRERRYSFEEFDFDFLRRIGVSTVRVDVGHSDESGAQTALRRIRAAGLNPLAIISARGIDSYAEMAKLRDDHPAFVEQWRERGVEPEYAWYAEKIYQLVAAYKDVVRDWEFGNEPAYWQILPEDYAAALRVGFVAAKLADPNANVMAGDLSPIHAPVFRFGAAPFMDSVAMHIYGFYTAKFWGLIGKMRAINAWKIAAGIPATPVWLTEIGGCNYSSVHLIPVRTLDESHRYQALHQPKIMAGGLAFGAAKVLPYNFRDVPVDGLEEEFGMIDRYGLPKPAVAAFRVTARLLGAAKFNFFIKGHTTDVGAVAGLAFRDAENRDVAVYWRNDPYGDDNFSTPFLEMVKAPITVAVPCADASAEIFDLSGGRQVVAAQNGFIAAPVSEYPIFVRGNLPLEKEDVPTARADVPPIIVPRAATRILPQPPQRAADLMSGTRLLVDEGTPLTAQVRIYNLRDEPLTGTLRLIPKNNWREYPWSVAPSVIELTIPPRETRTTEFTLPPQKPSAPERPYFLDAIFIAADGFEARDTAIMYVRENKSAPAAPAPAPNNGNGGGAAGME